MVRTADRTDDGGLFSLTIGFALARRCGLPVSLVSGSGDALSEALVRNQDVAALAFVGGKSNGRDIAASLYDREKRYMLDFGPLINPRKVEELRVMYSEAVGAGAINLFEGELDEARFLPGQDISAYLAPISLLNVPRNCRLHHNEPFGPIDSIVVVDRVEELISEMNISNGNLVSSIACDDPATAREIAGELRSFKVGINQMRSRGDCDEVFGGMGASWKGCFVGGAYLVQSVTCGKSGERPFGNFPDYTLLPERR